MKELDESINEAKRRINGRDRWRSDYRYEDDLEHDYGCESSYHNLYDAHQFPCPCNKDFPTILSGLISQHQVSDPCNPLHQCNTSFVVTTPDKLVSRHEPRSQSQSKPYIPVINAVKKQDKQSPFDFSEIPRAPHPMPNNYTRKLPQFNGNKDISIESHLDILWDYMEIRGADSEDVYMLSL